ncbi:MAG: zf-HC2 domain-containing protein [Candidatus Acidiferrales bacterium]
MKCTNLIEELSSYLDDALDPGLRAELETHLQKCKRCRLVVDTCRKTINIYCNSDAVPLPEDTRNRLHNALREKLQRAHR